MLAVEQAALGEQRSFRRVEVLGLGVAQRPAAEGNDPPAPVADGEDHAPPEAVVGRAAIVRRDDEPGLLHHRFGDFVLFQRGAERGAAVGRVAKAELSAGFLVHATGVEIAPRLSAARPRELRLEPLGRFLHHAEEREPLFLPRLGARVAGRQRKPRIARQPLHRLGEREALVPHDEADHVAMGAAAEAVKEALLLVHREGGRLLVVKGAEPQQFAPAAHEADALADHAFQRNACAKLVQELRWERHPLTPG